MIASRRTTTIVAVGLAAFCAWAVISGGHALFLATTALCFAIAAVGLTHVVAGIGQVSLGHAGFFGLAAYTTGLLTRDFGWPVLAAMVVAVLAATLWGAVVGPLALRSRGIAFVMVTLAFGELATATAEQWRTVTGGDDGLTGVTAGPWGRESVAELAVVLVALLAVIGLGRWFAGTTVGRSVQAARQDEDKATSLGYPVRGARIITFIGSAAVVGLAGALFAHHNGFVSPTTLTWLLSGELLVMVLVGGGRTMAGAVVGAIGLTFVEDWVSSQTDRWELLLGAVFIGVVVLGVYSSVARTAGTDHDPDDDPGGDGPPGPEGRPEDPSRLERLVPAGPDPAAPDAAGLDAMEGAA